MTSVMNSKFIGPRAQVTHRSGLAQWRRGIAGASTAIQSGCAFASASMRRVRICPGHHIHTQASAAFYEVTKGIAVAEKSTPVMKWDFCWVKGHIAPTGQTCRVGVRPSEIIQPEVLVIVAGIVFSEYELRPAHRPIEPVWRSLPIVFTDSTVGHDSLCAKAGASIVPATAPAA